MFEIEYLTDELTYVAGRCATPNMLARCPSLRDFMVTPDELSEAAVGSHVRRELVKAIRQVEGREFRGKFVPTEKLQRALAVNLGIENSNHYAESRRARTALIVGQAMSHETWRKGVEREFLSILAETIFTIYRPDALSA